MFLTPILRALLCVQSGLEPLSSNDSPKSVSGISKTASMYQLSQAKVLH